MNTEQRALVKRRLRELDREIRLLSIAFYSLVTLAFVAIGFAAIRCM